jgi:hypothetical protein
MLAEWTASFLHVCKFIFILKEELAAFVAVGDGNVRDHIFIVLLGPLRAELRVVDDKDLLIAHALEDSLVNFDRLVLVRVDLRLEPLEHAVRKEVILEVVIVLPELHRLLVPVLLLPPIVPALCRLLAVLLRLEATALLGWVHLQKLHHFLCGNFGSRHEFNQRKGVKACEIAYERMSA